MGEVVNVACDQTLYATGEPCGRTKYLQIGVAIDGSPLARCKRHAKRIYGWRPTGAGWDTPKSNGDIKQQDT